VRAGSKKGDLLYRRHPTGLPLVDSRSHSPFPAWLPGDSEARKEVEYGLAESIGDRRVRVVEDLGAVLAPVERDDGPIRWRSGLLRKIVGRRRRRKPLDP
jgi:hypothetical protein